MVCYYNLQLSDQIPGQLPDDELYLRGDGTGGIGKHRNLVYCLIKEFHWAGRCRTPRGILVIIMHVTSLGLCPFLDVKNQ